MSPSKNCSLMPMRFANSKSIQVSERRSCKRFDHGSAVLQMGLAQLAMFERGGDGGHFEKTGGWQNIIAKRGRRRHEQIQRRRAKSNLLRASRARRGSGLDITGLQPKARNALIG